MRACPPHAPTCSFVCERARLRVGLGAQASAPQRASTFRRRGLRVVRQVFQQAPAFNANIGAWNTARVTTLYAVHTAFGRHARSVWSARPLCAAALPMRVVCAHT